MAEAPPMEIAPRDVQAMLQGDEDVVLLDCREPKEHAIARVGAAQLVPMGDVPSRLQELQAHADRTVVVMCHHGMRSLQVAQYLRRQGFDDVRSMAGGIDAWSREIDASVPRY